MAAETVRVEGERVIVRHVYTERRVTPLNLFLRDAEPGAAREAVIEYGNAIKDLAAADIFTGDMLLKNFGVTRNGRVICYDYDELCLLSECRFRGSRSRRRSRRSSRRSPGSSWASRTSSRRSSAPSSCRPGEVRDAFLAAHGDLLDIEFWQRVQRRLGSGDVVDVFPYRRSGRSGGPRRRSMPDSRSKRVRRSAAAGSAGRSRRPASRSFRSGSTKGRVVGLGGVGGVGQGVAAAGFDHRFEPVNRRPEIGELVVGLVAEQPDAPLSEHVEVVLARPRLLFVAVRIERGVELRARQCVGFRMFPPD